LITHEFESILRLEKLTNDLSSDFRRSLMF
jgi:hypothetical protein